jgi:hypothetical protein
VNPTDRCCRVAFIGLVKVRGYVTESGEEMHGVHPAYAFRIESGRSAADVFIPQSHLSRTKGFENETREMKLFSRPIKTDGRGSVFLVDEAIGRISATAGARFPSEELRAFEKAPPEEKKEAFKRLEWALEASGRHISTDYSPDMSRALREIRTKEFPSETAFETLAWNIEQPSKPGEHGPVRAIESFQGEEIIPFGKGTMDESALERTLAMLGSREMETSAELRLRTPAGRPDSMLPISADEARSSICAFSRLLYPALFANPRYEAAAELFGSQPEKSQAALAKAFRGASEYVRHCTPYEAKALTLLTPIVEAANRIRTFRSAFGVTVESQLGPSTEGYAAVMSSIEGLISLRKEGYECKGIGEMIGCARKLTAEAIEGYEKGCDAGGTSPLDAIIARSLDGALAELEGGWNEPKPEADAERKAEGIQDRPTERKQAEWPDDPTE